MNLRADVSLGAAPPDEINIVVTAPVGAEPFDGRIDRTTGALVVTRLYTTAMRLPGNLGLVPMTANEGGEPLAALLAISHILPPGAVVAARPVGVLYVAGEEGDERTILAVPAPRLTSRFDRVRNYTDLGQATLRQIAHFFSHYRDLDTTGRLRTTGWGDVSEARRAILEGAERALSPAS